MFRCFNPRAPRGARLRCNVSPPPPPLFQSTRPARGATPGLGALPAAGRVSIHAPRAGRDQRVRNAIVPILAFQSTRPARGATWRTKPRKAVDYGFNPRAPRGARRRLLALRAIRIAFQSTRPARGATYNGDNSLHPCQFQSTRPARGATGIVLPICGGRSVSIHAPRAGRDHDRVGVRKRVSVSIHAPRAGRDMRCNVSPPPPPLFQSTRPARGATQKPIARLRVPRFQSTRPARGATKFQGRAWLKFWFQSTRPARGATCHHDSCAWIPRVSIHAPRAGRDLAFFSALAVGLGFNPRAPRGARQSAIGSRSVAFGFQSTRPARGATAVWTHCAP